jgi:pimeloyl-ACP methyl ester carboxylesterase
LICTYFFSDDDDGNKGLRFADGTAIGLPGLIEQLRIPVVAINPDDAPTDLESMAKYGVDVEIMPGVGHFLMMDDADGFNELVLSIVAQHSERL